MQPSPRDPGGPEIVTQEHLLLDATERVGRIRDGRMAVHLHLSRLKPQNRQEGYLRVAGRMLEPMVSAYRGQIFLLTNSDIVFLVNQPSPVELKDHIHRLRGLFAKDPLANDDSGDGLDLFCTLYDLTFDYDAFITLVKSALADARTRVRAPQTAALKPLDANALSGVLERLTMLDAAPFVRRQSAIALGGGAHAEVIFQEFFVSVGDLQKAIAPDTNLAANRWMFQHLSATLDRRLLEAMRRLRLTRAPAAMHLNLTIPSLLDPAFQAFEQSLPEDMGLGIEVQILDVLADSRAFFEAQRALKARGRHLVIDGLNEATLTFMEVGRTGADLYKLDWTPEMREPHRRDSILAALKHVDPAKLLLARCDSEAAIAWGLEHGLHKFQGRYIESMLAATTLGVCDKAAACTLAQCTSRHGVISGPLRQDCGNNLMLDTPPAMLTPARKTSS
jgi:hypothetical protein